MKITVNNKQLKTEMRIVDFLKGTIFQWDQGWYVKINPLTYSGTIKHDCMCLNKNGRTTYFAPDTIASRVLKVGEIITLEVASVTMKDGIINKVS